LEIEPKNLSKTGKEIFKNFHLEYISISQ